MLSDGPPLVDFVDTARGHGLSGGTRHARSAHGMLHTVPLLLAVCTCRLRNLSRVLCGDARSSAVQAQLCSGSTTAQLLLLLLHSHVLLAASRQQLQRPCTEAQCLARASRKLITGSLLLLP